MSVALLQLNATVGDFSANSQLLLEKLREAELAGGEVAVASELVVCGYPPRDLLDSPRFVRLVADATAHIVAETRDVPLVFGTLGTRDGRLSNDAVVAAHGREIARSSKVLLPNYDVFDEHRYFQPGAALGRFEHRGRRYALSVCEDAWGAVPSLVGRYAYNPLDAIDETNTDTLINLSASPFTLSKLQQRDGIFADVARRRGVGVVMVNQVGGNDELIFDGRSAVFDEQGTCLARAAAFEAQLLLANWSSPGAKAATPDTEEAAYRALVLGVRDYARKCGFSKAVLGLSGGIDSALVACIAADALGPGNVVGVAMPTRYSSEHSIADAQSLAKHLGIRFELIDIDPIFDSYISNLGDALDGWGPAPATDVTWENVQARIRGATVMAISNRTGALPLTTGNKSEVAVGYCTLYGDMVGGLSVISDVPKTMVYRIARYINRDGVRIPPNTLTKPPSAELRPDQKDEDSLPPYDVLDPILEAYIEEHRSAEELVDSGFDRATVERVVKLVRGAEYKRRQAAPGLILTRKAFGPGRRMPIAQKYVDLPGNKGRS